MYKTLFSIEMLRLCTAFSCIQDPSACDFGGVASITTKDPTTGNCKFLVGMKVYTPTKSAMRSVATLSFTIAALALALVA